MNDQVLALVTQYGPPAIFAIVGVAAVGVPLPVTLLLIVVGSMVSQGAIDLWVAMAAATAGSILGDQAGYAIGRFGGTAAIAKLSAVFGRKTSLDAMETKARTWGGPGIFITRWLLSPLGPWINLACGTAGYPWPRFLFWDVVGETTGAVLYIWLGRIFSDRVIALDGVLGDLTWAAVALAVAIMLGYQLWKRLRKKSA
ncbi:MAG TPA: DedA family protein [Bryobacteraceae bacterium]|jgi:membrane protein DedA with SNARE-associated domain|nr:DedA family protein [Bryobacteraceae bacterium]